MSVAAQEAPAQHQQSIYTEHTAHCACTLAGHRYSGTTAWLACVRPQATDRTGLGRNHYVTLSTHKALVLDMCVAFWILTDADAWLLSQTANS